MVWTAYGRGFYWAVVMAWSVADERNICVKCYAGLALRACVCASGDGVCPRVSFLIIVYDMQSFETQEPREAFD